MTRNTIEYNVSLKVLTDRLAKRQAFKEGYDSFMRNEPYNYDIEDKVYAVNYGRGRCFAIWSKVNKQPKSLWKNGVLSAAAKARVERAIYSRAII